MKNQELTLLNIFDVVMTERSVTRAADHLSISQPAVSNAISRMRSIWSDQIFIKKGSNIEPTLFAYNLWNKIHEPIQSLNSALNTTEFDLLHTKRQFRIALTDLAIDLAWLPLLNYVSEFAPNINVYAMPFNKGFSFEQLKSAQVDFVFGSELSPDSSFKSIQLYEDEILIAMNKSHNLSQQKYVTLEDFTKAKILLVNTDDDLSQTIRDRMNLRHDSKEAHAAVNNYTSALKIVQETNYISSVPASVAGISPRTQELRFASHPMNEVKVRNVLTWHVRSDMDKGFQWFKKIFVDHALNAYKQSIGSKESKTESAHSRLSA